MNYFGDNRVRFTRRPIGVQSIQIVILLLCAAKIAIAQPLEDDFFEKEIRPLLIESCLKCHGPKKQSGGLRLDSRAALLRGGESGPAIIPKDPKNSRLISAVLRKGDLEMPPEEKLSPAKVLALIQWVKSGAPWPKKIVLADANESPHWAFQPVRRHSIPTVQRTDWVRTPIDAFVLAKLQANDLLPSSVADRRTLIRRTTFNLHGLPPTADEVDAFVQDDDPQAYSRLINRLLASPHYGEKWGRHWLDVARYSDSKGYVYAREERFWVHAWTYRDWVVRALNRDLPYDQFLLLQLAADQLQCPQEDLAAMGFLTIGRRFLGVTHDIIDDRIDVVTRGMMGLTVACARCHDHKYDPIPTRDYYSMYGVFKNCTERLVPIAETMEKDSEFARELHKRTDKLNKVMSDRKQEAANRVRSRISDYLIAQLELEKYPEEGFDQILVVTDIMPAFVRRWRDYLAAPAAQHNPVFVAWQRFAALPANQFTEQSAHVCRELQSATEPVHATVKAAFLEPPADMHEVAQRYGKLLSDANLAWKIRSKSNDEPPPEHDALLQVLYAPDSPCRVPDEAIVDTERFFPTKQCEELWKLRGAVDRWLIESKQAPPHALILEDRNTTTDAYVLKRGNPATPGELVPRQPLQILSGSDRPTFRHGSGRLELARAIVDPTNPLTARVAVNRIWMHHFGRGLVDTPSDFGRRAETPSHPELLDWLAAKFVEDGWSLKKLHRLILLSAAYRQSSFGHKNPLQLARAQQLDPENRWLWRMNTNRLMFEELHDSALAVTGDLQRGLGGKPTSLFGSRRRTLYSQVDRQFLPSVLRVFDFATPDLHVPRRSETIVPQQALFFMNHQFFLERARSLARKTARSKDEAARVHQMYRAVYQRAPTADQLAAALGLIKEASRERQAVKNPRADQWQYGFGEYDSKQLRLINFKPLPFFDGSAWQGGPKWPDPSLGWVQLTAAGGHAGNDKQHAAVRRFTAERKMVVSIESALVHEAKPGDGVRGFLVLGRGKLLKSAEVHLRTVRFDVDTIELEAGETVDFIVDLRDNLNHEEFLWRVSLTEVPEEKDGELQAWSSERDFGGKSIKQLGPWEQLAQVLLAANEFLFVD